MPAAYSSLTMVEIGRRAGEKDVFALAIVVLITVVMKSVVVEVISSLRVGSEVEHGTRE